RAAEARIVVTNHAFVLTDAIVRTSTNDEVSLLDDYDFLIVDEAHDLLDAAASALKFNLDQDLVDWLIAHAAALSNQLSDALTSEKPPLGFLNSVQKCGEGFAARCREAMGAVQLPPLPREGVAVRVAPEELARQPALASAYRADLHPLVAHVADTLRAEISALYRELEQIYRDHKGALNDGQRAAVEETLMQFRHGFMLTYQDLGRLKEPTEGVSWVEPAEKGWQACYEPLMLADWLRAQLWQRQPALLMSATLTVDGRFDFFKQQLGLETPHLLRLPPVFDYGRQCALYLPPLGTIPDPPQNAHAPGAGAYYQRLADEIGALLRLTHGRALVLFASRHEMHEVYRRLPTLPDVRVMLQGEGSNADLSKQFREDVHSVLFGVRSFWTGFDAPGETLMNLILTRIPFEVPTTPLQRARQAWFELQGVSAFAAWALPMAKQQMRQGFGRLIRRSNDTGIVAILDPRMRTKSYGREILNNLPQGIPIFDSIDALAHWLRQQVN
ncbi:MAG: ATP-dependent DNA helicase, partial [Fimbriimonadales bacterium]